MSEKRGHHDNPAATGDPTAFLAQYRAPDLSRATVVEVRTVAQR